jgi:murein DD-endopeptidase MepM/ murein hydrolase activator NlpD
MGRGSHEKNRQTHTSFLQNLSNRKKINYVIDPSISFKDYIPIDISDSNPEVSKLDFSTSEDLSQYIESYLSKHNAKVAYGGYLEKRKIYQRSHKFSSADSETDRNIHLGVDFWCPAGTSVTAVLRGKVHSFQNNDKIGDYGPTIILEHTIQGETFYTLYGHLSLESLEGLEIGQEVEDSEIIGAVGDTSVNGDYTPHLHFQIIENLQGMSGDYPGVSSLQNLEFYQCNCPDPNVLLNI